MTPMADGCTSFSQDHYLTVTLHYLRTGNVEYKSSKPRQCIKHRKGPVVAQEMDGILEEFEVSDKVVAATVDNATNMHVALKKLRIIKVPCFAHTLNLSAQKVYNCTTVYNWAARIRSVVVWMKTSHMAKVVLKEKQCLLSQA